MDPEPLQMANGDTWHLHRDEQAGLVTLTIKSADGGVKMTTRMTADQLDEFRLALADVYARAMEITPEKIIKPPPA